MNFILALKRHGGVINYHFISEFGRIITSLIILLIKLTLSNISFSESIHNIPIATLVYKRVYKR
jgi:hypothetical protein